VTSQGTSRPPDATKKEPWVKPEHVVPIIVALITTLGLVTTTLITVLVRGTDASSEVAAAPAPTVTVTAAGPTVTVGPSGPSRPSQSSTASGSPGSGQAANVRHEADGVKVAHQGESIDLNAPASDPVWASGVSSSEPDTLSYSYGYVYLVGAGYVTLDKIADYESCRQATGYSADVQIDVNELENAKTCLKLASGRFGNIEVTAHDSRKDATLSLTVWEES
jgi:hypothetical protein